MRPFLFFLILITFASQATADTVVLKNKEMVKGVVVEDYADRITLSTFEGEKTIRKEDIESIEYDSAGDNIVNLAAQYRDKGEFGKAYFYYDKAYRLNPGSETAKDGLMLSRQAQLKQESLLQDEEVRKRRIIENFHRTGEMKSRPVEDYETRLKNSMGITVDIQGVNPEVVSVLKDSPADKAGIATGDKIVAIWSRLTGYLTKDEVLSKLLEMTQAELRLSIERVITVKIDKRPALFKSAPDLLGVKFVLKYEGTVVDEVLPGSPADRAGIKKDDLIVAVGGSPTRYMDLKSMYALIERSEGSVVFMIRRALTVWKKKIRG